MSWRETRADRVEGREPERALWSTHLRGMGSKREGNTAGMQGRGWDGNIRYLTTET